MSYALFGLESRTRTSNTPVSTRPLIFTCTQSRYGPALGKAYGKDTVELSALARPLTHGCSPGPIGGNAQTGSSAPNAAFSGTFPAERSTESCIAAIEAVPPGCK